MFRLPQGGCIAPGYVADIVVFQTKRAYSRPDW
jgi:dihydroorotase-like cyclic amidohydrolase